MKEKSQNIYRRYLLCILTPGLFLFAVEASAQLTALCDAVNRCSVSGTVTPGVNGTVSVLWRGTANVENDGDVFSDSGRFTTPDNTVLGVLSLPLRQRLLANAIGAPVSFSVNESLRVPANVSQHAASLGEQRIIYRRAFTFDGVTLNGSVTINLNPPSPNSSHSIPEGSEADVTGVGINRISLRFSSGSQVETIDTNQPLHAIATVNFERAGLLDAIWEVATPASTSGQAIFRPLQNVRQYLAASRQVALQSPSLPSDMSGIYRVRLRLLHPSVAQAPVELRYQVNESQVNESQVNASSLPIREIIGVLPQPGAVITAQSEFSWQVQAGAKAWQLEIYEQGTEQPAEQLAKQPLTGLLLGAEQTRSPLSASVFSYLEPGQVYYWRVVAVGEAGTIIAASELREIRMQK